jgi:hypothetical protein
LALHHLATVAGVAAVIAGIAVAHAVGAPAAKPTTVTTKGAIEALALDGRRVAYDLEARELGCNTVHVRDVHTGKDVVVSGAGTCEADSTSTGAGVRELTLGGARVAWVVNLGGNTESVDTLYTAVAGVTKEKKLAQAIRTGDVDGELVGDWLGNLAGDGDLLVANRWKTLEGGEQDGQQIVRVASGLTGLFFGPGALSVRSVDTGRIAVHNGRAVFVRNAAGGLVTSFQPAATIRDVALRKDYAVVLTSAPALEVHDAATGAHVKTIPVPAEGRALDVHANIATIGIGKTIRAVRLATGVQATIAATPKPVVDVQIDDAGVVYAFNPATGVKGVGKLVFLPLSLVQSKVGS